MAKEKKPAAKNGNGQKAGGDKIVKGRLMKIKNTQPKFGAASHYFRIHIEDENGKNERAWFLTAKEVEKLEYRASQNKEDVGKKSPIRDLLD